jgi:CheY-like chemotaxis protein
LTLEAFRETNSDLELHVANDGAEALAFLRNEGVQADAPRPELILLDLNMPKKDGREVLAVIKADESLKLIPTVILYIRSRGRRCQMLRTPSKQPSLEVRRFTGIRSLSEKHQ